MNVYLPNLRLPSEYQEVEYIRTSGTQYINTGLTSTGNDSTELEADLRYYNNSSSYQANGKNNRYWLFIGVSNANKFYGGSGSYWGETSVTNDRNKHHFKISTSETKLYIDGTGYSIQVNTNFSTPSTKHIGIGCVYGGDNDVAETFSSEDIYSFKIKQSGNLVRNYVPCYRKSDSVIGLYDLVNNQFYTNAGTGTFSKGNDVTMAELKNAYIGEVWTPGSNTIAYYKFDGNLNDSSGNNNTGTANGTVSYATAGEGQCLSISGGNNCVKTPISETFFGSAFTIAGWFRFSSINSVMRIMGGQYNAQTAQYSDRANIQYESGFGGLQLYSYNGQRTSWNWTPVANTWYHIVVVGGGVANDLKAYINGAELTKTRSAYDYTTYSGAVVAFGGNGDGSLSNYYMAGNIDNAILENIAWTADEILSYYNQTKSNYGL